MTSAPYLFRALRPDGVLERGSVEAESHEAAATLLAGRGLFPIELAPDSVPVARRERISVADLALGLNVLATLLESGLPIGRALAVLEGLAPASWRGALPALRTAIREGKGVGAALAASSLDIPPVVIGIVRAGEAGSGLAPAVRRAAELAESMAATRAAVRSALAYPVILAIAGAGSMALLVGVVLPRFTTILADLGQELPASTRFVLSTFSVARGAALPSLVALAVGIALWRVWVAGERGRTRWHEMLLSLPVLGSYRQSAATARVTAALAALLESGVPLAAALPHAARACGDAAISARLLAARSAIVSGTSVAAAFAEANALTPTGVRLVKAGEETGRLGAMLAHAARLEEERASVLLRSAVRLLEPGLILLFGGVIALVAAALLQAVYAVRPAP